MLVYLKAEVDVAERLRRAFEGDAPRVLGEERAVGRVRERDRAWLRVAVEARDVELPLPRDARLLAAELVDAPLQRRVPRALGLDPGRLEDREDEPVWNSNSELGYPNQTSELSISVKSTSIRLIFGRIDGSRRVLEARQKASRRNRQLRAH